MVIQTYAPTSNAEEAEAERFYEDLQDLLELTPKKDVLFIMLLLLSRFSHVQLFGTVGTVVLQAPLSFLRLHPSTAFQNLLLTMMATPFLLRDSCSQ